MGLVYRIELFFWVRDIVLWIVILGGLILKIDLGWCLVNLVFLSSVLWIEVGFLKCGWWFVIMRMLLFFVVMWVILCCFVVFWLLFVLKIMMVWFVVNWCIVVRVFLKVLGLWLKLI